MKKQTMAGHPGKKLCCTFDGRTLCLKTLTGAREVSAQSTGSRRRIALTLRQLIRLESPPCGYRTPEDTFIAFEVPKDWLMGMLDLYEHESFYLNVFCDMYTDADATEIYRAAMCDGVINLV